MKELERLKKVAASIYAQHYESHRQGGFDFPIKEEWVKDNVKKHILNNPELYGYVWDKENRDWVFEDESGCSRIICP